MTYIPKKRPKKAVAVISVLFFFAVILYVLGEMRIWYRMPLELSALILFSAGVMLLSNLILTDYKYVISDIDRPDGTVNFTVVRVTGKRENEMAGFDMADIYASGGIKKLSEFEKKYGRVDKVYNYCGSLGSPDIYRIALDFNGKKVMLVIEADEEFRREIEKRKNI